MYKLDQLVSIKSNQEKLILDFILKNKIINGV